MYYGPSIQDIKGLIKITQIINGNFRTPKIEALHRLINWLNTGEAKQRIKKMQ